MKAKSESSLSNKLAQFKAIARHIIKNDARPEHQDMFKQHVGSQKWRLKEFAVVGQQPAIGATRICTPQQVEVVETAIMQHRIGGKRSQIKNIRKAIKEWEANGKVYRTMQK